MKSRVITTVLCIALTMSVLFNIYLLRVMSYAGYEIRNLFASDDLNEEQTEDTDVKPVPSFEDLIEMEAEVIRLTNEYRVSLGLNELTQDDALRTVARIRAKEIVTNWAHERSDGTHYYDILDAINYPLLLVGENLAKGQDSAAEAMEMWKESSGHNANLLLPEFNKIGVGVYYSPETGRLYYVQIFAQ